jgi:hypothetical protein
MRNVPRMERLIARRLRGLRRNTLPSRLPDSPGAAICAIREICASFKWFSQQVLI